MLKKYLLCLVLGLFFASLAFAQDREIAITIDDLPFVGSSNNNPAKLQREHDRFMKILQTLIEKNVPATGFVIAGSIEKGQWELLEQFRQAGFILGNHTYSHRSLNSVTAEKYIDDVDRADKVLTPLFPDRKYFRYPYLAESSGQKKQTVYDYLAAHNYIVAPVTIDSKDFVFNQQLFAIPYRLREKNLNQLRKRYLAFIWNQTLKAESKAAKANPDKPVKQILLIHANLLNSHFLGDIIDLYRQNGYRFISLDEALTAPAETITTDAGENERYEMFFDDKVLRTLFNQKS
ncbi:polysaccharide deacetylase family protein [Legionella cardiaca]|uniref:Polysaccharide deacetylase family protein n=1 Tax=Legionella cardiaca TaxID=1071983 RepID=A0ABY8AV59_9GAMM|nr:polysaccharide deacetylase family protein [Legionella cardiaca]WED44468.1 polysaccharide deacetylase family protein [Legionella cardiaca]